MLLLLLIKKYIGYVVILNAKADVDIDATVRTCLHFLAEE